MNLALLDAYRVQTILGLLQAGVVVAGSLIVGSIVKAMGFQEGMEMTIEVHLVRHWGFVLLLLPILWVGITVRWERVGCMGRRHTLISGMLLLAGLSGFLILVAARAASVLVSLGES